VTTGLTFIALSALALRVFLFLCLPVCCRWASDGMCRCGLPTDTLAPTPSSLHVAAAASSRDPALGTYYMMLELTVVVL